MKKFVTVLLTICLVFGTMCVFASEVNNDSVEVNFMIGSNVITINGVEHNVETAPYVVEPGVTLVPVRIITEAFGANVNWIEETETVTVSYPDVEIVLQIGNTLAEVNGKAETLLAAPELVNDRTMVPIRFISENFGAEVKYFEETESVSIIKETSGEDATVIDGVIDALKVGDSYYNWSMENSSDMYMSDRDFTGDYTCFDFDDSNYIEIEVYETEEEYDFERTFSYRKNEFAEYTLVKAEKDTSNPNKKSMHFQYKDAMSFNEYREIVTDDYIFCLYGTFDIENSDLREKGLRVLASFDATFDAKDTHDLSNVADGTRRYESENMKYSISVPQNYFVLDDSLDNKITLVSDDENDYVSQVSVCVYSVSDAGNAKEAAENDYNAGKMYSNEEICDYSVCVSQVTYGGIDGYFYTKTVKSENTNSYMVDFFFDKGDYLYNVTVSTSLDSETYIEDVDKILNSLEVETLDSEKIGILMRNRPELEGTYILKEADWQIEAPCAFQESYSYDDEILLENPYSGAMVSVSVSDSNGATLDEIYNRTKESEKSLKNQDGVVVVQSTRKVKINSITYVELILAASDSELNQPASYNRILLGLKKDKMISIMVMDYEEYRSEYALNQIDTILNSLTIK